ncbi:MAG: preprotein translocase subunit SecE [Epsilonproteobacteria bacterium]|nr:preprotein translocase subunit SecE [Campylobacterota bacterium]
MSKINNLIEFLKEAKAELDKVIFPTKQQVKQAFIAVVIVVSVVAAYLALIDLLMSAIVGSILKG